MESAKRALDVFRSVGPNARRMTQTVEQHADQGVVPDDTRRSQSVPLIRRAHESARRAAMPVSLRLGRKLKDLPAFRYGQGSLRFFFRQMEIKVPGPAQLGPDMDPDSLQQELLFAVKDKIMEANMTRAVLGFDKWTSYDQAKAALMDQLDDDTDGLRRLYQCKQKAGESAYSFVQRFNKVCDRADVSNKEAGPYLYANFHEEVQDRLQDNTFLLHQHSIKSARKLPYEVMCKAAIGYDSSAGLGDSDGNGDAGEDDSSVSSEEKAANRKKGKKAKRKTRDGKARGPRPNKKRRDAPEPSGATGVAGRECYNCGLTGHLARACPQARQGGSRAGNNNNGDATRGRAQGGAPMNPRGGSGGAYGQGVNPMQGGARPRRPQGGGPSRLGSGGDGCRRCGRSGHWAKDCFAIKTLSGWRESPDFNREANWRRWTQNRGARGPGGGSAQPTSGYGYTAGGGARPVGGLMRPRPVAPLAGMISGPARSGYPAVMAANDYAGADGGYAFNGPNDYVPPTAAVVYDPLVAQTSKSGFRKLGCQKTVSGIKEKCGFDLETRRGEIISYLVSNVDVRVLKKRVSKNNTSPCLSFVLNSPSDPWLLGVELTLNLPVNFVSKLRVMVDNCSDLTLFNANSVEWGQIQQASSMNRNRFGGVTSPVEVRGQVKPAGGPVTRLRTPGGFVESAGIVKGVANKIWYRLSCDSIYFSFCFSKKS